MRIGTRGSEKWPGPGQSQKIENKDNDGGFAFGKSQRSTLGGKSLAPGPGNYNSNNQLTQAKSPGYSILGGKITKDNRIKKSN